jgi:uncharacterized protein YbjQ (UPF0145 family)
MTVTTGLSGNEIFCLAQKNFKPGNIVVGNSVHSLGVLGSITSGFRTILGGEITQFTSLIKDGREAAYKRLEAEADTHQASGVTGVTSELIMHAGNIEFLSIGSAVHSDTPISRTFTTSADGQELFAQLDCGYQPICFAFGNVAYSIGVGRGLLGGIKTLRRGEIKEYSDMFNLTRHLALDRIITHAKQNNANAVLGIQTTILPFGGVGEMLMVGTASTSPTLAANLPNQIVTSDMTNVEMWNVANMGYMPMKLLLGTSVFSLGIVGGIVSSFKSFIRGEINELTRMIYDARENAIGIINDEAKTLGADDVVGVKTYVYQLGNGLVEFLAIGTAIKKFPDVKTESSQLPAQAIIVDKTTFYDAAYGFRNTNVNLGRKPINPYSAFVQIIGILLFVLYVYLTYNPHHHF